MHPAFGSPSEIQCFGVYLPPFFFVVLIGLASALLISRILNWTGRSDAFWHPPLAFVAMWVLASSLVGLMLVAP